MFEKLEFPRQGAEDQAAIVLRHSEYNDESQYIDGEEQGEKGNAVIVLDEKPIDDIIKLYPGDSIKVKDNSSIHKGHRGRRITIKSEWENYGATYYCCENEIYWHITQLDTSTLIRAAEQKPQIIEPQVGDIVEWESIQEKYVLLISEYGDSDYFRTGMSCYRKNCIKRILYRLGEDYIEKAPGIGVNK